MTEEAHAADARPDVLAMPGAGAVPDLPLGAPIYSRDRQRLGSVKEVRGRCFLVDVRLAFDYWLSGRCVAEVCDGRVMLAVDKRDVSAYLVDIDCPDDVEEFSTAVSGEPVLGASPAGS